MSRKINTSIVLSLFSMITFLFVLNSCDTLNGHEEVENTQYSFDYKIYDEHGDLLSAVSDKQIDDEPIKASAGYFGLDFFPPGLLESLSENSPIDPEDLKENQIYLHAETGLETAPQTYSLRLKFPNTQQWKTGEYQLQEISKEKHLEFLQFMWERRQNNPFFKLPVQGGSFMESNQAGSSENLATIQYSESGFVTEHTYGIRIDSTGLLYQSTKGAVELTHVSDNVVEGDFTIELVGFPMEILFFSDEFPENPELQVFTIMGNFTAIPGDYYDLVESSENLLQ